MKKNHLRYLMQSAMLAALYVALTMLSYLFGLSSGAVQVRLSEALCVLPVFTTAAIPGLTVGCFLANLLTGGTVWDLTVGVLATLIGLLGARLCRRHHWKYMASVPTILSNALLIPLVLIWAGFLPALPSSYGFTFLTVGLGELIACGGFGTLLTRYLDTHPTLTKKLF